MNEKKLLLDQNDAQWEQSIGRERVSERSQLGMHIAEAGVVGVDLVI